MIEIHQEQLEAWLFAQPRERVFDYLQGYPESQPGCLLCNFFRETFKQQVVVSATNYSVDDLKEPIPIPIMALLSRSLMVGDFRFTAGQAQDEWVRLFGQPDTHEINFSACKADTESEREFTSVLSAR